MPYPASFNPYQAVPQPFPSQGGLAGGGFPGPSPLSVQAPLPGAMPAAPMGGGFPAAMPGMPVGGSGLGQDMFSMAQAAGAQGQQDPMAAMQQQPQAAQGQPAGVFQHQSGGFADKNSTLSSGGSFWTGWQGLSLIGGAVLATGLGIWKGKALLKWAGLVKDSVEPLGAKAVFAGIHDLEAKIKPILDGGKTKINDELASQKETVERLSTSLKSVDEDAAKTETADGLLTKFNELVEGAKKAVDDKTDLDEKFTKGFTNAINEVKSKFLGKDNEKFQAGITDHYKEALEGVVNNATKDIKEGKLSAKAEDIAKELDEKMAGAADHIKDASGLDGFKTRLKAFVEEGSGSDEKVKQLNDDLKALTDNKFALSEEAKKEAEKAKETEIAKNEADDEAKIMSTKLEEFKSSPAKIEKDINQIIEDATVDGHHNAGISYREATNDAVEDLKKGYNAKFSDYKKHIEKQIKKKSEAEQAQLKKMLNTIEHNYDALFTNRSRWLGYVAAPTKEQINQVDASITALENSLKSSEAA